MIFTKQFNFLENSGFLLAALPCTQWLLSVLLMVGSWTLTLANVRKTFSCLEVTLRLLQPRRLLHVLLWSDLCWSTTSREGNSGLEFPLFVHSLSDCGLVESTIFRDGFIDFLAWWATSTLFPRSSVISFVRDMIPFHKHDQTWIDPCSLNKKGHGLTFDSPCTARETPLHRWTLISPLN